MKKILVLFFSLVLSSQLLAGTAPISDEEWAQSKKEEEKYIYKTDNTLESFAGVLSSPTNSSHGFSWVTVSVVESKIKGYNRSKGEVNIRGIGKAYIEFDGPSAGVNSLIIKFKKSQVPEEKILGNFASQFDPKSELTSIMPCDTGSLIFSKDIFRLVLPGRTSVFLKIDSDDEFVKFVFSPHESLTCDGEKEAEVEPNSVFLELDPRGI